MPRLVGIDEAGYGPRLGPLVVAATLWRVPGDLEREECCKQLACALGCAAQRADRQKAGGLLLADSKVVYRGGRGLARLERGVLAALGAMGLWPASAWAAWRALAPPSAPRVRATPWYAEDFVLPLAADRASIEQAANALGRALAGTGIELVAIRARAVFEEEFNRRCAVYGSKSTVLSEATMLLVRKVLRRPEGGCTWVLCDKHGGRSRYGWLFERFFPGRFFEVRAEGRGQSVYRLGPPKMPIEFCFASKAERYVPVALASMVAKYLRELAMHALNRFWQARVCGLRPTAGYPLDARRFKRDIAQTQHALGIADSMVWRSK